MNKELILILLTIRSLEKWEGGCFAEVVRSASTYCIGIRCENCPCAIESYDSVIIKDYAYLLLRIPGINV